MVYPIWLILLCATITTGAHLPKGINPNLDETNIKGNDAICRL